MTRTFELNSSTECRIFEQTFYDALESSETQIENAFICLTGERRGSRTLKTIQCDCPKTALKLARRISRALSERKGNR
jgi:hypothetical protein